MDIVSGNAMKCNVKDANYHDKQTDASLFGIENENAESIKSSNWKGEEKGEKMKTKGMFQ